MSAREPEPAPHYMAVTADNLETPVAVFDDLDAMCRWARISKHVAYWQIDCRRQQNRPENRAAFLFYR